MLSMVQILALSFMRTPKKNKNNLLKAVSDFDADSPIFKDFFALAKKHNSKCTEAELNKLLKLAEDKILTADEHKIDIISILDPRYPKNLKGIDNQPLIIFVKGNSLSLNMTSSVAVVGTRTPTKYASDASRDFASALAGAGVCVISGLALGCDTAAHEGALAVSNGCTIAVLAHGLDTVYPVKNSILAKQIIDNGGCLVSEYAPGIKLQKGYLVDRDRIQSGLANATFVVQSSIDGGTMHTAQYCVKQGRFLACLDPDNDPEGVNCYEGNKNLISTKGAKKIKDITNIELFLNNLKPQQPVLHSYFSKTKKRQRSPETQQEVKESPPKTMKLNDVTY